MIKFKGMYSVKQVPITIFYFKSVKKCSFDKNTLMSIKLWAADSNLPLNETKIKQMFITTKHTVYVQNA